MKFKLPFVLALILAGYALPPRSFAAPPAGYYEVWGDEFNSPTLDTTKWDYWLLGSRRDAINTPSAVSLNGSNLVITTYTTNGTHYTAMVANDLTFHCRYGYWEASILWGDTNGMWSAFWMQSPTMGTYLSDPAVSGSELDIVEHRSTDGGGNGDIMNQVQNNIHWNGYGSAAESAGSGNIGSGLGSGFHTYGFLWTPTAYTVYIDGSNVRSWNFSNNGVPISESTEWTILSSEVDDTSTTWAGDIPSGGYGDLTASTTKMTVDYVRYYVPTNTIFWSGAADGAYLTNSMNFVSNMPPLITSDLTFSMLSGNNLSPVPGADLNVDGLVFLNMNNGVIIGGANTLTLGAGGIDMVAANHSVTINCPINVGANQAWLIGPNSPGNTLNANGTISGAASLSKGGYGTLILNGANTFSGILNMDTGSTSANDGVLRITSSANIADVASPISIRNNNSGSSTLQLDATSGNITIAQVVSLAGRNTNVIAIQNVAGTNTISGNFIFASGGGNYWFDSDSGTLNLSGLVPASAPSVPSPRTLTFMGAGNIFISGVVSNANGYAVSLIKTNSGTLTLTGANTYTGPTTVFGGSLAVNGTVGAGGVTINSGTLSGSGVIGGATVIQSGSTLAPGVSGVSGINTLTIEGNLTLAAGSTTLMKFNETTRTNDQLDVSGSLTFGGTLNLSNLGPAVVAGNNLKLFDAASYSGAFTSVSPATPGNGLVWNTNTLALDGTLRVVAGAAPFISQTIASGNQSVLNFAGGPPNSPYRVFVSTNLAIPLAAWTPVWTDSFDIDGSGEFTNPINPAVGQEFLDLRVP